MGRHVLPDLSARASSRVNKNSALGPRLKASVDKSGNTGHPMS